MPKIDNVYRECDYCVLVTGDEHEDAYQWRAKRDGVVISQGTAPTEEMAEYYGLAALMLDATVTMMARTAAAGKGVDK